VGLANAVRVLVAIHDLAGGTKASRGWPACAGHDGLARPVDRDRWYLI
jgi:hypothetical protein